MKATKLLICGLMISAPLYARAESCKKTSNSTAQVSGTYTASNCQATTSSYYTGIGSGKTFFITSCTSCKSGYLETRPSTVDSCENNGNDLNYMTCECNCSDCNSADWGRHSLAMGYESRTTATCSCTSGTAVCSKTTSYRCASGYYGTTTNGTSGCTSCPYTTDGYHYSNAGAKVVTDCYLPKGKTAYDSTGYFTVVGGDCHYSN